MVEPRPIYLDAAASTRPSTAAREAVRSALDGTGDVRATHAMGRRARVLLEESRATVAQTIGAEPDEVVFTSGGTEANALAVIGTARAAAGGTSRRIVTTVLEHPSVLEAARSTGFDVIEVGCDGRGTLDIDAWAAEVAVPDVALASLQFADHHLGTIQPLAECARLAAEHGVPVHADACQAVAVLPVDVHALHIDLLSISAHKAYGPPGSGALFIRRGLPLAPLLVGDGAEHRLRAGMPNLLGIAGMAAALREARPTIPETAARLWALSGRLRSGLLDAGVGIRVPGHPTQRVPHIVTMAVPDVDGETLLMTLEDRGIQAGTVPLGPLVRARLVEPGEVVVRFGLSRGTTGADIDRVLEIVPPAVRDLRTIAATANSAFSRHERHGHDDADLGQR